MDIIPPRDNMHLVMPDFVWEVLRAAALQHAAGQIFDITGVMPVKSTFEHDYIHPLGVVTWSVVFVATSPGAAHHWLATVSCGAADDVAASQLGKVRFHVWDGDTNTWRSVMDYEHRYYRPKDTFWLAAVGDADGSSFPDPLRA